MNLDFAAGVTVAPPTPIPQSNGSEASSGGSSNKQYEEEKKDREDKEFREKLLEEDTVIEAIIRSFLICQN